MINFCLLIFLNCLNVLGKIFIIVAPKLFIINMLKSDGKTSQLGFLFDYTPS